MALDTDSAVWAFKNWGEPTRLVSPSLDCSSPETTPIQMECGRAFSAVLTGSGNVYIWGLDVGTFGDLYQETIRIHGIRVDIVPDHEGVIPCRTREFKTDLIKLPALPDLPDLVATGLPEEKRREGTRLIKIAACSSSLVGLTNKGHILKSDAPVGEDSAWTWHYVSENMCVLMPFLKPWCSATKLLRNRQD